MRKDRKVVVTGMGAVTPLGIGVKKYWENLVAGRSGVRRITLFDPAELESQVAGEVPDFDPLEYMEKSEARRNDRFTQFIYVAGDEAIGHSGLDLEKLDRDRTGVIIGSGIGGLQTLVDQHNVFLERGPRRVSPFLIPMMIADMASGLISMRYKLRGPNLCTVSACASGNHSIGEASRCIERGDADVMICGGAEAPIVPLGLAGFVSMKAVTRRNDKPEKASRPFDKDRDGFVISEGAAALVLESEDHALKRGADIHAVVAGYGASADAYHIAAPEPNGAGAYLCMKNALSDASIDVDSIDYINAHGTSTPVGDGAEVNAVKRLFGKKAYGLKISSVKSMTGHLLGAAGGIEAVATIQTIKEGIIPPTINLDNPEFDLDFVPNANETMEVSTALTNSFGFGGHNAAIVLTRYERK